MCNIWRQPTKPLSGSGQGAAREARAAPLNPKAPPRLLRGWRRHPRCKRARGGKGGKCPHSDTAQRSPKVTQRRLSLIPPSTEAVPLSTTWPGLHDHLVACFLPDLPTYSLDLLACIPGLACTTVRGCWMRRCCEWSAAGRTTPACPSAKTCCATVTRAGSRYMYRGDNKRKENKIPLRSEICQGFRISGLRNRCSLSYISRY